MTCDLKMSNFLKQGKRGGGGVGKHSYKYSSDIGFSSEPEVAQIHHSQKQSKGQAAAASNKMQNGTYRYMIDGTVYDCYGRRRGQRKGREGVSLCCVYYRLM